LETYEILGLNTDITLRPHHEMIDIT